MPFWGWSKTAASNATADPTINWAEGQPPSSVNDSARALMARTAEFRDDISGAITTGGSSTAYTVASNQVFDTLAHMAGAMVAFVPHTTSGNPVTINVDGLGAKPLRFAPNVELPSGALILGTPYIATYNNSDGAFYLHSVAAAAVYAIPLGGLIPYTGTTAPNSSFALPFGQAISRTVFATYFAMVSTTFGAGDGSTTFNIPDLRGRSIFGLDNMGGSAASRITVAGGNFDGTSLGATGGAQNHTLTTPEIPSHTHVNTLNDPTHVHGLDSAAFSNIGGGGAQNATISGSSNTHAASTGITITNAAAGGGGAHTILPPAMVLPFILRVI